METLVLDNIKAKIISDCMQCDICSVISLAIMESSYKHTSRPSRSANFKNIKYAYSILEYSSPFLLMYQFQEIRQEDLCFVAPVLSTEHASVVAALDLYLGGVQFESQPEHPSWLRFFVIFHSPSWQMLGSTLMTASSQILSKSLFTSHPTI
jgi:hypothetical protein